MTVATTKVLENDGKQRFGKGFSIEEIRKTQLSLKRPSKLA